MNRTRSLERETTSVECERDGYRLRCLCHEGDVDKVEKYVGTLDPISAQRVLDYREGLFGYTALHVAAINGHFSVLNFLLSKGGNPNLQCKDGSTPLHLAANNSRVECVRCLVRFKADPNVRDGNKRTANEVAGTELIRRCLRSAEITNAVERNVEVLELLKSYAGQLEPTCLDCSLIAAVERAHYKNAGWLLLYGATNIDSALQVAKSKTQGSDTYGQLILMKAAFTNDVQVIAQLYSVSKTQNQPSTSLNDSSKLIADGHITTHVPIEIAKHMGHADALEELLLHTGITKIAVDWSGLQLLKFESKLMSKISGYKQLNLSFNGLTTLPSLADFRQVRKLCLQDNNLTSIPAYLLELPQLCELTLARNKLASLPECHQWSNSLIALDLSQNKLCTFPKNVKALRIRELNLASNELNAVPMCICNFVTLQFLNLSDNKDIQVLPIEMGRLRELIELNLEGLKKLKDIPKDVLQDTKECKQYLSNKLYSLKPFYRIKLVLVGMQNRGKTTLANRLQGRECGNESTVGVDINEWEYKPNIIKKAFTFSVWDFGGQEEYYATHQCFLSEGSIYLLVFSVTSGNPLNEVQCWLNNIALRTPGSCVLIVGTHLDEVSTDQRAPLDVLLENINNVASMFSEKLQIKEIFAVGLKNDLENVELMKESIYKCASEYKFEDTIMMGQLVPASYHVLDKSFLDLQKSIRKGVCSPIMEKERFKSFINDLNLIDIWDEDELIRVTHFLTNIGTILHYDDRSHNLDKLYFVDPLWLCNMMSRIVTIKEKNPFIHNGIMLLNQMSQIFRDDQFPMQYFDQYLVLLDRFEIALVLDKNRLLIPSMLPNVQPCDLCNVTSSCDGEILHTRYILFGSPLTPPGYWSRVISRVIHSVPQVQCTLEATSQDDSNIFNGKMSLPSSQPMLSCQNDNTSKSNDLSPVQLKYWRTGVFYKGLDTFFLIQSLMDSCQYNSEGVVIMSSLNTSGTKIFGQLVDIATSLFQEWYRGGHITQLCPCTMCRKLGLHPLAYFQVDQCLQAMSKGNSTLQCSNRHVIHLCDVIPDLLLLDISSKFILEASQVEYEENESILLGIGGFSKVYLGKCHGQSVAIKVYQECDSSIALEDLRREAIMLQKFHHPCLICLVGICTHPKIILVLEEAPLGSLEKPLLKSKQPIHRIVLHRILTQVAAALKLLHSRGIIFRDLKAANVLLWSLDPEALCHCKLSDLGIAIHANPIGARGIQGTRGFIAPEVLHMGKNTQSFVYDHMADIFSFGMLIFQITAHKNPFENYKEVNIDSAVINGERPVLSEAPLAENAFFFLSQLMQICWGEDPRQRPSTGCIIDYVCLSLVQSIMCVHSVKLSSILWKSCVLQHTMLDLDGNSIHGAEVVVFNEGEQGLCTNVQVLLINSIGKSQREFSIKCLVEFVYPYEDYVFISPRAGTELGTIYKINIVNGELTSYNLTQMETVSCVTCSKDAVYCGTVEGSCFSIPISGSSSVSNVQKLSDHCIDSLVVTPDYLWVSHTHHIRLLELTTLVAKATVTGQGKHGRSLSRSSPARRRRTASTSSDSKATKKSWIGVMKLSPDGKVIYSCHLRNGSTICLWDVQQQCLMFEVDAEELLVTATQNNNLEVMISAMTPVLDTVWVGTTSGHILVIHNTELVLWFNAYSEYVCFLECIHCKGPCETEAAMVVSGAKGIKAPVINNKTGVDSKLHAPHFNDEGFLVLWEAFPSKLCRQIKTIENESSTFLNTHESVKEMIIKGKFSDILIT